MSNVKALVLTGYGLNCDHETAYALELAGALPVRVHINSLINGSVNLNDFQIMVFVGGFSWGDDHGAGVIQSVRLKTNIGDNLLKFVDRGNLVLGICNGFQTLVNMGLLPGFEGDYKTRSIALTYNDCGNFRDDWVRLKVDPLSPCVFTKGFDFLEFPVRHGEGKFYSDKVIIEKLLKNKQVALQYATPEGKLAESRFPFNPNGSANDIAGICDSTGRIFGLMPHPEAYNHPSNHPDWIYNREIMKRSGKKPDFKLTTGIRFFKNGVDFIGGR